jgi:phospholipase C
MAAFLSIVIAVGCGGGSTNNGTGGTGGGGGGTPPPPPPPPPSGPTLTNFTVSPTIAGTGANGVGQFVNFNWTTTNATSLSVTPIINGDDQALPLQGPFQDTSAPAQTTTFTAVATNGTTNSQPATVTLTVVPVTLTSNVTTVEAGNTVTLTYGGPNNNSTWQLLIGGNPNPTPLPTPTCSGNTCTGTFTTGALNANTTFTAAANGPAGGQAESTPVSITVGGATTITLTANPQNIQPGASSTLTWASQNASSVTIAPGLGPEPLSGSAKVTPTQTTTYTATATSIYPNTPPVTASVTVTVNTGGVGNLNHIIYMVQENRAFDNYLGVFANYRVNIDHIPGAQLSDVNDLHTLPPNYQICNPQGGCFGPFHARTVCIENLSPSWDETHYDMDLVGDDWLNLSQNSVYKMDRFLDTTLSGGSGDQYDPTHSRPLGYYDQTDLPFYYELGAQFATSDTWYSPIPANTVPNRMYLFSATSHGHAFPPTSPSDPAWQVETFFRALNDAHVTWRYYYQDNSVFLANWADWNDPAIQGNVRNIQEYYSILSSPNADQNLPQVVFIERGSASGLDEHPDNNIQTGAADVQNIITALLNSAAWPDSAFILTYDEGGGLFDHVGPILATPPDDLPPQDLGSGDQQGLFNVTGFRVPVIVISPWAKPHYVSHLPMDYTAILKLIENRFNVPPLTQRDATAGDMTDPQNGFFDFSSPQMLTVPPLPTQPTNGDCDQRLEGHP